ncbi:MAG: AzlC family ABC transporter permease [Oscillospiraceae bacterium]
MTIEMATRQNLRFRDGIKDGLPIALGYLSVSFTFGITAVNMGIPAITAVLISLTNVTSAGQVAGIGIIAAGGGYLEMALAQLIINMRYALMSLSLSQKLDSKFNIWHRLAVSFCVTDEVFAVASGKDSDLPPRYMYGLILLPYLFWSGGTAAGALLGSILPDSLKSALGIAIYGMFIAIIVPPARKNRGVLFTVAVAAALSCLVYYIPFFDFISSGISIIICTVIAAALGAVLFPREIKEEACENG